MNKKRALTEEEIQQQKIDAVTDPLKLKDPD
jgi:hypothetical protein